MPCTFLLKPCGLDWRTDGWLAVCRICQALSFLPFVVSLFNPCATYLCLNLTLLSELNWMDESGLDEFLKTRILVPNHDGRPIYDCDSEMMDSLSQEREERGVSDIVNQLLIAPTLPKFFDWDGFRWREFGGVVTGVTATPPPTALALAFFYLPIS